MFGVGFRENLKKKILAGHLIPTWPETFLKAALASQMVTIEAVTVVVKHRLPDQNLTPTLYTPNTLFT